MHRDFELPELKLLVDAVQSSKFLSARKSRELIRKLEGLASRYEAQSLQRQVYVAGRVKSMNESIYYTIDQLHAAISADRQVSFLYGQWTVDKTVCYRRNGQRYRCRPTRWCGTAKIIIWWPTRKRPGPSAITGPTKWPRCAWKRTNPGRGGRPLRPWTWPPTPGAPSACSGGETRQVTLWFARHLAGR